MTPLLCEYCPLQAVRLVEVDSALDSSTAENAALYLCAQHCQELLAGLDVCRRHIMVSTQTTPDSVPDNMTLLRVQTYDDAADDDTADLTDWYDAHLTCNDCADAAIEALAPKAH